jgi:hypothetical protein
LPIGLSAHGLSWQQLQLIMPAYLHALETLTAYGLSRAVLERALVEQGALPVRAAPGSCAADLELRRAAWIDPIPEPERWQGPRRVRFGRLDRLSQMTLLAAHEAIVSAGVAGQGGPRAGIVLGTAYGSHATNESYYRELRRSASDEGSPTIFAYTLPSAAAAEVSIHFKLEGPSLTLCHGVGAGLAAIALGAELLAEGKLDWVVSGGVDVLGEMQLVHSSEVDRSEAPPFAEGAAFCVLKSDQAGALARVGGWGQARGADAAVRGAAMALDVAGLDASQVRWRYGFGDQSDDLLRRIVGRAAAVTPVIALVEPLRHGQVQLPALIASTDLGIDDADIVDVLCITPAASV